jgi:hypothetical protein
MTAEHPSKRVSRDHYRATPERFAERMAAWRASQGFTYRTPNAAVVWEGPSRLDGSLVVVIAAGLRPLTSPNVKTGDMVQLYILPLDVDPRVATKTGEDAAVCGTCPHRPSGELGDCYVNVAWAPRNLWLMYHRGGMPRVAPSELAGAAVRFGAWGDPAAVPLDVWSPIVAGAFTHTGYTQEWPRLDEAEWGWLMASVASTRMRDRAQRRGWRTFRVEYGSDPGEPVNERECLAAAHGVTCIACGGCGGTNHPRPTSFRIRAHGFRYGPAGYQP